MTARIELKIQLRPQSRLQQRKRGIVQIRHGYRHEAFEMHYIRGTHRSQQHVYSPVPAYINIYPSSVLANIVSHYRVAALLTRRVTNTAVEKKKDVVVSKTIVGKYEIYAFDRCQSFCASIYTGKDLSSYSTLHLRVKTSDEDLIGIWGMEPQHTINTGNRTANLLLNGGQLLPFIMSSFPATSASHRIGVKRSIASRYTRILEYMRGKISPTQFKNCYAGYGERDRG
ncbi:hypothetical protein ARMGADRAFT_1038758 [Armillaria gallica]|uniref:Uncharacterized protein n=1 Tax=Armillaria gallica TaxID=47427 RepID=A0A2H3D1W3_ARMGA|nr:hypothetical protein ARMGADRAFT_1038758 [Armillaria gallica]